MDSSNTYQDMFNEDNAYGDFLASAVDDITIVFGPGPSANDVLSVKDGGIDANKLATNAVTTTKIADLNVTDAKIVSLDYSKLTNVPSPSSTFTDITLTNTSNQIKLGTSNVLTLSSTPTATYTITIPDTATNANFVLTEGNQTINGNKSFSGTTTMSALTASSVVITNGSKQLASLAYTATAPTADTVVTRDVSGNTVFRDRVTFDPTIGGIKSSLLTGTNSLATTRYFLPDSINGDTTIITTQGDQTMYGNKWFEQPITIFATSNQLSLGGSGSTNWVTISAPTPAATRTHTIPDVANANFVMSEGMQTINGVIDFDGTVNLDGTINMNSTVSTAIATASTITATRALLGTTRTAYNEGDKYGVHIQNTGSSGRSGIWLENNSNNSSSPLYVPIITYTNTGNSILSNIGVDSDNDLFFSTYATSGTVNKPAMTFWTGGVITSSSAGTYPSVSSAPTKRLEILDNGRVNIHAASSTEGLYFQNTSISSYISDCLNVYEESTSASINFTGMKTMTKTCHFSRIGNIVYFRFPNLTATSTSASTLNAAAGQIPARFRPVDTYRGLVIGVENGTNLSSPCGADVGADGSIVFYKNAASVNWAAAVNDTGPYGTTWSWTTS